MPADDVRRADVREIQSAADRAAGFIRQTRCLQPAQLLQPEVLELNAVITGTESMVRRLVGEDVVPLTEIGILSCPGSGPTRVSCNRWSSTWR